MLRLPSILSWTFDDYPAWFFISPLYWFLHARVNGRVIYSWRYFSFAQGALKGGILRPPHRVTCDGNGQNGQNAKKKRNIGKNTPPKNDRRRTKRTK